MLSVPSALESQCFVLINSFGGDLLVRTVTPSGGFDTLASDFNYIALIALLGALVVIIIILKIMNQTTSLRRIWN